MKTRKHLSSEQKALILREWIEDGQSVSDVAEKYSVTPNDLYRWSPRL